ncbi:SMI1/KNR4 family protein [Streptomyces sp. NPDC020141]|uniref:SMI1/KNR4 family protein n=1 Tax=Streptomyces sp. NPDC020141 TaxID=3365065 RepID=UPI0037B7BD0B
MHPSVARLIELVAPASAPRAVDWERIETALGTALPDDYKEIVEVYGGGVFDETLWILEPDCADPDYDLIAQTREQDQVLAELWGAGEPKPAELQAGARVIPWANTEGSGHYLYWLIQPGQKPAEWTVMLNEGRGPEWERHSQTCAEFLVGVMTGDTESVYFPDLPPEVHQFDSNADIL